MTIDRINVKEGYGPLNCRWITQAEQVNNTNRNRYITINGETKTATQWAREKGISKQVVMTRLYRNWDETRLFEKPRKRRFENGKLTTL